MSLKCVLKAITLSNSIGTKKYEDYVGEVKFAEEATQQVRWTPIKEQTDRQSLTLTETKHFFHHMQAHTVSSLLFMSRT